jgi:hypothetical protein
LVICCCSRSAQGKYGGGNGLPNDPYLIFDANQMNAIGADSHDWDKHFMLMADIDLGQFTGQEYNIIGLSPHYPGYGKCFTGVFDGNGHSISNFTYNSTGTNYIGLFGYVEGGQIKNLGLIDPNVDAGTGSWSVGSLVGHLGGGIVTNCYAEGGGICGKRGVGGLLGVNWSGAVTDCHATCSVSEDYPYDPGGGPPPPPSIGIGGLTGWNGGTITDCYSDGDVYKGTYVGGLCGGNDGKITNSYATGSVVADKFSAGGLVGVNNHGTIIGCYALGSVVGDKYSVGGLVGWNRDGYINYCYSTGSVTGLNDVGGLVGSGSADNVVSSFWDIESSGQTNSNGGIGKTTAQMQMASTFLHWGTCDQVWTINDGVDYPRLTWEQSPGEPIVGIIPFEGDGVPDNPYLIHTPEQLNVIGLLPCVWDKHFKLMANIDLRQYTGIEFNVIVRFTGTFDGNGHTISNFSYTSVDTSNRGLFGRVSGANAQIKDLGVLEYNVDAGTGDYVGSLVGSNDGTITNCYVEAGSVSGDYYVGGLVGYNRGKITNCCANGTVSSNSSQHYGGIGGMVGRNDGTITTSYSSGTISGRERMGGLVGYNNGTITECTSSTSVSADSPVGGLLGANFSAAISDGILTNGYSTSAVQRDISVGGLVGINRATVLNSYSTGNVSGVENVGGLVGENWYSHSGNVEISKCYSTGSVSGTTNVGGLVGLNDFGTVSSSFWDVNTSGQETSAGGTGLPTAQMKMAGTFTDAGWDFVGETVNGIEDIWFIPQKDYPHLWWEGMQVPMKLTPRTLNCRSYGNWVKVHLTLPQGFTFEDVDSNRPAVLHSFGFVSATLYVFVNKDKLVQIEAAFERQVLCSLAGDWPQMLTVAGFLADGNIFLGTSTVRIIHPGLNVIEELAWYWLNEDCLQPDFCDQIDMNRDSVVNLADYALLMNINVEFVTDE